MPSGVFERTPEILAKWRKSVAWYKVTDKTKKKISQALKGRKRPDMVLNNPMFKKEVKDEFIRRNREKNPSSALYLNDRKRYQREYMRVHKDKWNEKARERYTKDRIKALEYYSDGEPECACCKEGILDFLSIDHINGVEDKHKINGKRRSGSPFYAWLRKNNYPTGFQVLCHNCNLAKGFYGKCPHQDMEP